MDYLPYNKARLFSRTLKLRSSSEWYDYTSKKISKLPLKPSNIPKAPKQYYKNRGWLGWEDWLGETYNYNWSNLLKQENLLNFEKAKKIISKFNLKGIGDFKKFKNSNKFPKNLPKNPYHFKNNPNWKGLLDYLGKETN